MQSKQAAHLLIWSLSCHYEELVACRRENVSRAKAPDDNPYDGSMREQILALKSSNELSATGH
jgi:hypothetical protein